MMRLPRDVYGGDIHQWLGSGYFVIDYEDDDEVTIATMDDVDSDENVLCVGLDGDEQWVPKRHIFVHWPRCGAININNSVAVLTERSTARQWTRTYTPHYVEVTVPFQWAARKLLGRHVVLTSSHRLVVQALFNPKYDSWDEARHRLISPTVLSRAIHPTILVGRPGQKGPIAVFHHGIHVAHAVDDRLVPIKGYERQARRCVKHMGGIVYAGP